MPHIQNQTSEPRNAPWCRQLSPQNRDLKWYRRAGTACNISGARTKTAPCAPVRAGTKFQHRTTLRCTDNTVCFW